MKRLNNLTRNFFTCMIYTDAMYLLVRCQIVSITLQSLELTSTLTSSVIVAFDRVALDGLRFEPVQAQAKQFNFMSYLYRVDGSCQDLSPLYIL